MLLGKRFFPKTGTTIWKIERRSVLFAVWLPEPFTVATWMLSRFTMGSPVALAAALGAVEGSGMGRAPRKEGAGSGRRAVRCSDHGGILRMGVGPLGLCAGGAGGRRPPSPPRPPLNRTGP